MSRPRAERETDSAAVTLVSGKEPSDAAMKMTDRPNVTPSSTEITPADECATAPQAPKLTHTLPTAHTAGEKSASVKNLDQIESFEQLQAQARKLGLARLKEYESNLPAVFRKVLRSKLFQTAILSFLIPYVSRQIRKRLLPQMKKKVPGVAGWTARKVAGPVMNRLLTTIAIPFLPFLAIPGIRPLVRWGLKKLSAPVLNQAMQLGKKFPFGKVMEALWKRVLG